MFKVEFVTFFPLLFTQSLLHSFICMHAYFHYTLVTSSAEDKENHIISFQESVIHGITLFVGHT